MNNLRAAIPFFMKREPVAVSANIRDGTVTRVGSANRFGASITAGSALAVAPNGTVYILDSTIGLHTLNLSTGVATRVGSATRYGISGVRTAIASGLAIAPNGTAYAGIVITNNANQIFGALYRLNLSTGVATRIGSANNYGVGIRDLLGFTIAPNGTAYAVIGTNLYTINLSTGVATRVGTATQFGVSESQPGAVAAAPDGVVYMVGQATDAIYRMNLSTGGATQVGSATRFGASLSFPRGLVIIADGTVYMIDSQFHALYRFNTN